MQIAQHKVVSIEYTLKNDEGEVIDTSDGRGPMVYLHGAQNLIPGLEAELEGKVQGDSLTVRIAPADAYGELDESKRQTVAKDMFGDAEVEVGAQFHAADPSGDAVVVTVVDVDGDDVVIDGNHPLAGVHLNFDVSVADVREASEEEIEHGHVHGPEGHEH